MDHVVIESKKIAYSINEFWDNGIIFIKINDHAEIRLEDSKAQLDFLKERYDGVNKFIILVEPGRYTSITKEAREFSTLSETNEMTAATAVIIKSLAQRLAMILVKRRNDDWRRPSSLAQRVAREVVSVCCGPIFCARCCARRGVWHTTRSMPTFCCQDQISIVPSSH